jgi:hypothetical protein
MISGLKEYKLMRFGSILKKEKNLNDSDPLDYG